MRWSFPLLIGLIAADQITKDASQHASSRILISSTLQTTAHWNSGLIANIPLPMWLILGITGIAIIFFAWHWHRSNAIPEYWKTLGLTFILAGALGNFFDRIRWGAVFDWILLFERSVINLADIWVVFGALFFLYPTTKLKLTIEEKT